MGITQGFGQQAVPAWRDYANRQFEDAVKAGDEEAAQCWGPDGACRAAGHALVGGLSGGIEGASAAALSSAGAPHLQAFLQSQGVPDEAARAITQLGALGAGAAVGGSAGASAGLNEASHNAVMAIPILVDGVVAGGAAAARACLSSPACLNALRMGGAALVAKVASLVDPADLAQIPGFDGSNPNPSGGNTASPVAGPAGDGGTTKPGMPVGPLGTPASGAGGATTQNTSTASPLPDGPDFNIVHSVPAGDQSAITHGLEDAMNSQPTPENTTGRGLEISRYSQGTWNDANRAFDNMPVSDVRTFVTSDGGIGRQGLLPDGTTVIVRPVSSDGTPTIQIIDNNRESPRTVQEIRFGSPRR